MTTASGDVAPIGFPELAQDKGLKRGALGLLSSAAHELVLAGREGEIDHGGLPDSGLPAVVVAPDLSNLPPGAHVVDLREHDDAEHPRTRSGEEPSD